MISPSCLAGYLEVQPETDATMTFNLPVSSCKSSSIICEDTRGYLADFLLISWRISSSTSAYSRCDCAGFASLKGHHKVLERGLPSLRGQTGDIPCTDGAEKKLALMLQIPSKSNVVRRNSWQHLGYLRLHCASPFIWPTPGRSAAGRVGATLA